MKYKKYNLKEGEYSFVMPDRLIHPSDQDMLNEVTDLTENENKTKSIMFDFKDVLFIDSSGIGMLLYIDKNLKTDGIKFAITNAITKNQNPIII